MINHPNTQNGRAVEIGKQVLGVKGALPSHLESRSERESQSAYDGLAPQLGLYLRCRRLAVHDPNDAFRGHCMSRRILGRKERGSICLMCKVL